MPRLCVCENAKPHFALPGQKASHCAKCKTDGMVDVVTPKCFCKKSKPHFAISGQKASHCGKCKTDGMVDVDTPKCFCRKSRPSFALPGQKASHCAKCKTDSMVDVDHPKCLCQKARPSFALPGQKASHCAKCKTDSMVNVYTTTATCESCGLEHRADGLQDGRCFPCRRQVPRIELKVRDFLKTEFPEANWVFDKTVGGILVCSDRRYRPDCWLELESHVLVVECDEHQHEHYEQSCELRQGKPLAVIRWNPDDYQVDGMTRKTNTGKRFQSLRQAVCSAMQTSPKQLLDVQYMFYSDDHENQLQSAMRSALTKYLAVGEAISAQSVL